MKTVWSFLSTYRVAVYIALSLTLLELSVELIQPLLISRIIDEGILQEDLSVVLVWGGVMVLLSLIAFAAGITNSFYAAHASQHAGYDMRVALYKKIQQFSFANFQQFPTSSLLTRATNDVTQLQNTIFMSLRIMLRAPLLVLGSVILALFVNWQLALILVVTIPLLLVILLYIMKKAGRLFKAVQARVDRVNNVVQENLTAIRLIKSFTRRDYESTRFHGASEELQNKTITTLRIVEATMPIILLIMNVSIMAVLWFDTTGVQTGGASVGEVVAIVNYVTRMTGALSIFSMIIIIFSRAKASADRIGDVLEAEEYMEDGETSMKLQGEIAFNDVSFRYPGTNKDVLKNISFRIKAGETIAVLGATGSGKTSLFQLIPRLFDASKGSVAIDGQPVESLQAKELRSQIGYVPQEAMLFTGTIADNLRWGKEHATEEELIDALTSAQIYDKVEELPDGMYTRVGQRGVNLSGGQKQRISIARALIRNPSILLLDDSTSALDVKTEARLLDALRHYSCTTFMITQKLSTTMSADRILLFDHGELLAEGTHDHLLETSPIYQQIYESQFGGEADAR
ncbi:ABC transporter ATP-binding protein [Paenalkalicoccus suaedae]|uniref:ABC transporter ATP-binding protein n=1 Tax=Paenalkalicoccus suaedae TaxID=2592382 RepID=A0A859FCP9_9BACI|nr:ABC transporter ATP-binding protein [Paenalkalicoccus suaedae]QKS70532.1 ABC transporter ATP-binding protein [Paenalkalicoccus suaedae]